MWRTYLCIIIIIIIILIGKLHTNTPPLSFESTTSLSIYFLWEEVQFELDLIGFVFSALLSELVVNKILSITGIGILLFGWLCPIV